MFKFWNSSTCFFLFFYLSLFIFFSFVLLLFFIKLIFSIDWFIFSLIILLIGYFLKKTIFSYLAHLEKAQGELINLDCLLFFLFNFSLAIYFTGGLFHVLVPPLYDGPANSYYGKLIFLNQFKKFPSSLGFYQPGGSIFTSLLGAMIGNFALATNILTLISLACIPISFSLLIVSSSNLTFSKRGNLNKYLLIFAFLLFNFLGNWHQRMFFVGSKNSLIISTNFFFLGLYFLTLFDKFKKNYFLYFSLLLGFAASLIHYTSCFLYFIIFGFYLIKNRKILIVKLKKINFLIILTLLITIFISIFLYFYPSLIEFKQIFFSDQITLNLYPFLKNLFLATINYFQNPADLLTVLGLLFLIFDLLKKKVETISLFFLLFLLAFLLSSYFPTNVIKTFVPEYNLYLLPIFLSSLSLKKIVERGNKKSLITLTFFFLIIFSFFQFIFFTLPNINKTKQNLLVSKEDLLAFNWIKQKLNKQYLFFPLQIHIYERVGLEKRVNDLNALAYLKVFTDFESCPTAITSERSADCSRFFFSLIKNRGETLFNDQNLKFFRRYKIKYFYYSDHQHFRGEISFLDQVLNYKKIKEIYSYQGVKIFELDY